MVIAAAASTSTWAIDYTKHEEGWFWYELLFEEPEIEDETPEPEPEPEIVIVQETDEPEGVADKSQEPAPFSTAWLQQKIPESIERAMDDPGENLINVRVFAYLQKLAFEKAERFADNMHRVVLSDPLLDENNNFPLATYGRDIRALANEAEEERRVHWLADNAGLFYFHDSNCLYCAQQLPVIERFKERFDFNVLGISIDGTELDSSIIPSLPDDGHAVKFQVQSVPALVLVWPPNNAAVISQSILSGDQIPRRIINAAQFKGLLTEQVDAELGIQSDSYLDPAEIHGDISDDPRSWINRIREEAGYEPLEME